MNRTQILALQQAVGTRPDGFWGPKSAAAAQRHLRRLMPNPNPWPGTTQPALQSYYGSPGDESALVNLPVAGLGVRYDGKPVRTIRCHGKVAASLRRVLEVLAKTHPEVLADYCGCYNNRPMRGGSLPSLHARGAAIDFLAGSNANRAHWPTRANMPLAVMEAFALEGWTPAGAFWSRDAMHFQATRP